MTDDHEGHTRDHGVEFGDLKGALIEEEYPVSASELVEQYGGFEFDLPGGTERLEDVLNRVEESTFHAPEEVRDAVFNGIGSEALAREGYSDRDPPTEESDWNEESL